MTGEQADGVKSFFVHHHQAGVGFFILDKISNAANNNATGHDADKSVKFGPIVLEDLADFLL